MEEILDFLRIQENHADLAYYTNDEQFPDLQYPPFNGTFFFMELYHGVEYTSRVKTSTKATMFGKEPQVFIQSFVATPQFETQPHLQQNHHVHLNKLNISSYVVLTFLDAFRWEDRKRKIGGVPNIEEIVSSNISGPKTKLNDSSVSQRKLCNLFNFLIFSTFNSMLLPSSFLVVLNILQTLVPRYARLIQSLRCLFKALNLLHSSRHNHISSKTIASTCRN
nr:unnamed protein product [Callosobruchus chinensis]